MAQWNGKGPQPSVVSVHRTYLAPLPPVVRAGLQQQLLECGGRHKLPFLHRAREAPCPSSRASWQPLHTAHRPGPASSWQLHAHSKGTCGKPRIVHHTHLHPLQHHIAELDCRQSSRWDGGMQRSEAVGGSPTVIDCHKQQCNARAAHASPSPPVTFSPALSAIDCRVLPSQLLPPLLPPVPLAAAASSSPPTDSVASLSLGWRVDADMTGVGAGDCSAADSTSSTVSSTTCRQPKQGSMLWSQQGQGRGCRRKVAELRKRNAEALHTFQAEPWPLLAPAANTGSMPRLNGL